MAKRLTYSVVTPVRDEAENLRRLGGCIAAQTLRPTQWIVVDTGSTDDTAAVVHGLADELPFVELAIAPDASSESVRGAPIVRAFEHGVDLLTAEVDVVVKLDADVSFDQDYFELILDEFVRDRNLGIASGSAEELDHGIWRRRYNTGSSVWGAARAYRGGCLDAVRPLERGMGWDGIDEAKAQLRGWTTRTLADIPFRHHRIEGQRDGSRWRAWAARGRASHYMGYRFWYLGLRTLHHARREPAALAMLSGYAIAVVTRRPICQDREVRSYVRRAQRLRSMRARRREAVGVRTQ